MEAGAQKAETAGEQCADEDVVATASPLVGWASLRALCAIARFHQIAADPATLAHQLDFQLSEEVGTNELLRAAKHLGLKAKLSTTTAERLQLTPLPALAA